MLAGNVQRQALIVYHKHLELLREQQENNLPRNGKAPATEEDFSVERAFDEQLQAISGLLESTNENPELSTQQVVIPPKDFRPQEQTSKPNALDPLDTEPYLNPFTGQLIIPETPFTAESSTSRIKANIVDRKRYKACSFDHIQPTHTASVPQQSFPPESPPYNPKSGSETKGSSGKPDFVRSRPPYRSDKSVRSFDTRSTIPAARSYASQPAVAETVPVSKSRWGTISRLKHRGSKASFKARTKNCAEGLKEDDVRGISQESHQSTVKETSGPVSPATTTNPFDQEKNLQILCQQPQAKNLDPFIKDSQTRFLKNRQAFRRRGSLAPSNPIPITSEPLAPALVRQEAFRSASDVSNRAQFEDRQRQTVGEVHPKSFHKPFHKPLLPEIEARNPLPRMQYTRTSPIRSPTATSVNYEATEVMRRNGGMPNRSLQVASELDYSVPSLDASLGWNESTSGEGLDFSSNLAELTSYEESLKLAFELSQGFPQDYASLKQIQEEHEMSAQFMESERLARELACNSPQDHIAVTRLQAENEGTFEKWRLADVEWQEAFEADRKLAQSLAAEDVPQHIQDFHRMDAGRQLKLQEESRLAEAIAGREDRAEMEAQLAEARRLQEEWNASETNQIDEEQAVARRLQEEWNALETNHIVEEQRLARELSEQEDRLELEHQNAELQRMQEEWDHQEATQRTSGSLNAPDPAFNADVWTNDRLPAYTAEILPSSIPQGPSEPQLNASDQLPSYTKSPKLKHRRNNPEVTKPPPAPQQQGPTNPSNNRDAEELSRIIAERRARHGQWQADVQKANRAAKEAEEAIRKRAKEEENEIRRLEQQQRVLAEKARKEKEAEEARRKRAQEEEKETRRREQQQRVLAEKARKQEEARRAAIEAERQARQADCTVCGDPSDRSEMVILPCHHAYDGACIAEAFKHALSAKKPFKCCGRNQVPVDTVARFLPDNFEASYQDLVLELATPNPTYCSNSSCSAFVPPASIKGDIGTCRHCRTNTCIACKRGEHRGSICKEDKSGQKLLNLANNKQWQRCPHCMTMMEKESGCLHMTCRCGTESCYNCGRLWSTCQGTCRRR